MEFVYVIQSRRDWIWTGPGEPVGPDYAVYIAEGYHWTGHSGDAWKFASPQEAAAKAKTLNLANYQIVAKEVQS